MSDKERLQEIKRKAITFNQELREIDLEEHIDWLIEQAEKAEYYEMKYENTGAIFNRRHSFVYEKLKEVMEGEE